MWSQRLALSFSSVVISLRCDAIQVHVDELVTKLNWVVDIGVLLNVLKEVLGKYNYKNLNELFPGINTTTEFMSKKVPISISLSHTHTHSLSLSLSLSLSTAVITIIQYPTI